MTSVNGIPVAVTRKRVKNLNLRVGSDGSVRLSVPYRTSDKEITAFLDSRASWIISARQKAMSRPKIDPFEGLEQHRGQLRLTINELLAIWQPRMGLSASGFTIKKMRTRWGSCNPSTRHLNFSLMLAAKPIEQIEYVVVHELAHLAERGHGPRFQALMTAHLPAWKPLRKALNNKR